MKTPITIILLLLFSINVQAKTFDLVTPRVYQGDTAIIRIYPQFQTLSEGVSVCIAVKWEGPDVLGQEYVPNNYGEVFFGVKLSIKPGRYQILRIECGRGINLDSGYEELEVVEKNFPIRKRKPFKPTKGWTKEREIIKNVFASGDYSEKYFSEKFTEPLDKIVLSQNRTVGDVSPLGKFGASHGGVDLITLDLKTKKHRRPVKAINSGKVALIAKNFSIEGNMIIIDHGSGIFSIYMHLADFKVTKIGEQVEGGDVIGISGRSGRVSGPHLHFACKSRNKDGTSDVYVDPLRFIETVNQYLKGLSPN